MTHEKFRAVEFVTKRHGWITSSSYGKILQIERPPGLDVVGRSRLSACSGIITVERLEASAP
jgi:hypothetical protein